MIKTILILSCMFSFVSQEANAHNKLSDIIVKSCPCDSACYTDEVSNLRCDSRYAKFDSAGLPKQIHVMMRGITRSNQQFPLEMKEIF